MEKIGTKLHNSKDKEEILAFCKEFERIHIFGNGACANLVCRYLEEEGIVIEDTIVSDGHKKEDVFENRYKVYEISEKQLDKEDGIIICLKKESQDNIYDMLIEYKVLPECIHKQNLYMKKLWGKSPNTSMVLCDGNKEGTYFKQNDSLDDIGSKYKTDKSSQGHNYLAKYDFFLNKWRGKQITLLELGVFRGASINMWAEYFENAIVYGVDIDEGCKKYEDKNIKILIKDLGDEKELESLKKLAPQIIIDDASHIWSHQIKALYHLLPALQSGGVYILEDLGTSFYSYRDMGYDDADISAYDFCVAIAEVVCSKEPLKTNLNLLPIKEEIEYLASQIDMISFIHESCIIVKR